MLPDFDVLIVGGGLVGASLACALEDSGLRVAMAEASAGQAAAAPSFDERNLALARASRNALAALGVWPLIASPPSPIERIHVSSRGDFGAVRLVAAEQGLDSFGSVVVARELGAALEARLAQLRSLTRFRPARLAALRDAGDAAVATLQEAGGTREVSARVVVGADGTESEVRALLGIGAVREDYAQTLFVCTVQADGGATQTAYERFTECGPVAMLPLGADRYGSICTVAAADAARVAALGDEDYRDFLQERFGWRVGRLQRVGKRSRYALHRVCAESLVAPRAVLVGNAAQTLHPIGAQGFNHGLRDALTLAEEFAAAHRGGRDPGNADVLARHASRRAADRDATLEFSDGLVKIFANRSGLLRAMRSLGLLAVDRMPGLAAGLATGAMGYRGDVPALARAPGAP
jgi:2-octaprenyl-6-methoxyphenol hydroxylase